MKRTFFILLGFILLMSVLLGACGGDTTTQPTIKPTTQPTTSAPQTTAPETTEPEVNKYGGIFKGVIATGLSTPIGFPAEATPDSITYSSPSLEALVRVKRDGTIVPVLATSWQIADDGKSVFLTLREGVKFHDGSDFNAEVCKWNLDLQIDGKRPGTEDWVSVEVVDDYSIRINVTGYKNTMITNLAGGLAQMISKATFDEKGIEYCRWHPVGTGPFVFAEYERDAKITYNRNPEYWEEGYPYLDGLEWTVIADETVRKMAFQRGDIHMLGAMGITAQELQQAGYFMITAPSGTYPLVPSSAVPESPWSNLKVRQAASYALNREALAEALGFGFLAPAYQMYGGYELSAIPNLDKTEYNPDKARQLLDEAGYPDGFQTTMSTFTGMVPQDWANAVAAQLREVGINVELEFPEIGKYMSDATEGWDGLMAGAFYGTPNNPNDALAMYFLGYFYGSMERTDALIDALNKSLASETPDPVLTQAVIQQLCDDMTLIPYVEQTAASFYQDGVHDEGALEYPPVVLVVQYLWLDPDIR